jgi:hypothetical protein
MNALRGHSWTLQRRSTPTSDAVPGRQAQRGGAPGRRGARPWFMGQRDLPNSYVMGFVEACSDRLLGPWSPRTAYQAYFPVLFFSLSSLFVFAISPLSSRLEIIIKNKT